MGPRSFEADPRILVIENESGGGRSARLLRESGAGLTAIVTTERLSDALVIMAQQRFDVIVLDLTLPGGPGLGMLRKLRLHESAAAVVAVGENVDGWAAARALHEGAQICLSREELNAASLLRALHMAVQHCQNMRGLHQELATLRRRTRQHSEDAGGCTTRYEALRQMAGVAVFQTDAGGRCESIEGPWQALTGLAVEDALGRGWLRVLPASERRRLIRQWFAPRPAHEPFRAEHEALHSPTEARWLRIEGLPLCDADGRFRGYFGTIMDLSTLRAAETAAARRQQALASEQLARWRLESEVTQARRVHAQACATDHERRHWKEMRQHHRQRTRKLVARLRRACDELAEETRERRRAEALLAQLHDKLDARVHQRTAELRQANKSLRREFELLNDQHHDALRRLEQRMDHALSHIEDSTGVLVDQLSRQWSEKQTSLLHELTSLKNRLHKQQGGRRPAAGIAAASGETPNA